MGSFERCRGLENASITDTSASLGLHFLVSVAVILFVHMVVMPVNLFLGKFSFLEL